MFLHTITIVILIVGLCHLSCKSKSQNITIIRCMHSYHQCWSKHKQNVRTTWLIFLSVLWLPSMMYLYISDDLDILEIWFCLEDVIIKQLESVLDWSYKVMKSYLLTFSNKNVLTWNCSLIYIYIYWAKLSSYGNSNQTLLELKNCSHVMKLFL